MWYAVADPVKLTPCDLGAIALSKMGIGCHGFGVLDKAVLIEHSHGLTADGKTVAHYFEQGDGPADDLRPIDLKFRSPLRQTGGPVALQSD